MSVAEIGVMPPQTKEAEARRRSSEARRGKKLEGGPQKLEGLQGLQRERNPIDTSILGSGLRTVTDYISVVLSHLFVVIY